MSPRKFIKLSIYLLGMICTLESYSQYKTTPEFESYMKAVRAQKTLNAVQVKKFIPAEQNIDNREFQALGMTFRSKAHTEVMYTFNCSTFESCSGTFYVRYSTSTGEIITSLNTFFELGNCNKIHSLNTPLKNDSLAVSIETRWEGKCAKFKETYDEYTVREYALLSSGEIKLTRIQKLDKGREYPSISTELFTKLDMEAYSAKELTAMKNELLAGYGLIFQDAKLAKFFKKKEWYKPTVTQVEESNYSYIEKRNMTLIKQYEAQGNE